MTEQEDPSVEEELAHDGTLADTRCSDLVHRYRYAKDSTTRIQYTVQGGCPRRDDDVIGTTIAERIGDDTQDSVAVFYAGATGADFTSSAHGSPTIDVTASGVTCTFSVSPRQGETREWQGRLLPPPPIAPVLVKVQTKRLVLVGPQG